MKTSPELLTALHMAIANALNGQPGFRPGSFDSWRVAQSTASWLDSFGFQIARKAPDQESKNPDHDRLSGARSLSERGVK